MVIYGPRRDEFEFNVALRIQRPYGLLGTGSGAQVGHLNSHTALVSDRPAPAVSAKAGRCAVGGGSPQQDLLTQTPSTGLPHPSFLWNKVSENGAGSVLLTLTVGTPSTVSEVWARSWTGTGVMRARHQTARGESPVNYSTLRTCHP